MSALTIWLVGPAGAGKTTYLAMVFRELQRGALSGGGFNLRLEASEPGPLDDAIARLASGYPVRPSEATARRCRLVVEGSGSRGADRFSVELLIADRPENQPLPAGSPDGAMMLLAVGARAQEGSAPTSAARDAVAALPPRAPLALVLTQVDRRAEDTRPLTEQLREADPGWEAAAVAHGGPVTRYALSAYGSASPDDPALPAPGAQPRGLGEPLVWLLRSLHEARWSEVMAARRAGDSERATALASEYCLTFPESQYRAEAERLRGEGRPRPTRQASASTSPLAWVLILLALALASAALLLPLVAPRPAPSDSAQRPSSAAQRPPAELSQALAKAVAARFEALSSEDPQTVEACDEVSYGLRFCLELARLDTSSEDLVDLRQRALRAIAELSERRERLAKLEAAQRVRDWPELLTLIDELWKQGSRGPAHETARQFRRRFWRAWAGRTQGGREGHLEVARHLQRMVKHCHDLAHTSRLLAGELAEAQRFLGERWQWERFYRGGWFDQVAVAHVLIHKDCEAFRSSDGSAQLTLELDGKRLFPIQSHGAREPNAEGWLEYTLDRDIALELQAGAGKLTLIEWNRFTSNGTARFAFAQPVALFSPGASERLLRFDTGDGKDHVRVLLRFKAFKRYYLDALEP